MANAKNVGVIGDKGFVALTKPNSASRSTVYLIAVNSVSSWIEDSALDKQGLELKKNVLDEVKEYGFANRWIGLKGPYKPEDLIRLLFGPDSSRHLTRLDAQTASFKKLPRLKPISSLVVEDRKAKRAPARGYIKLDGYGNRKLLHKEASWAAGTRKKYQRISEDEAAGLLTLGVISRRLNATLPNLVGVVKDLGLEKVDYETATFSDEEYVLIKQRVLAKRKR